MHAGATMRTTHVTGKTPIPQKRHLIFVTLGVPKSAQSEWEKHGSRWHSLSCLDPERYTLGKRVQSAMTEVLRPPPSLLSGS